MEEIKRERNKEQAVLAVSDRELTERYEKVFTAAVNDVLREMNLIYQTLPNTIMPLKAVSYTHLVYLHHGFQRRHDTHISAHPAAAYAQFRMGYAGSGRNLRI